MIICALKSFLFGELERLSLKFMAFIHSVRNGNSKKVSDLAAGLLRNYCFMNSPAIDNLS